MPSLTVGITYHNEKQLLTRCLQSLVDGANPPDEILVFDDASQFPAKDYLPAAQGSIRVLRGEGNIGPSRARNQLLAAANGDYIHFHDADDWFAPSWAAQVRAQMKPTIQAIFTEVTSIRNGELYGERVLGLAELTNYSSLVAFCLDKVMLVPSGTYRRDFLIAMGGYREALWQSEDFDFHVRLAAKQPTYVTLLQPLVFIDIRAESRSQNFLQTRQDALKALELLSKELPDENAKSLAAAASRVGSELYQLGDFPGARRAWQFAKLKGGLSFTHRNRWFGRLVRLVGPEPVEFVSSWYRRYVPEAWRRKLS